jgi:hypothetical protein
MSDLEFAYARKLIAHHILNSYRTYAVEYGDSQATASNSSRKAVGNCISPILNFEQCLHP